MGSHRLPVSKKLVRSEPGDRLRASEGNLKQVDKSSSANLKTISAAPGSRDALDPNTVAALTCELDDLLLEGTAWLWNQVGCQPETPEPANSKRSKPPRGDESILKATVDDPLLPRLDGWIKSSENATSSQPAVILFDSGASHNFVRADLLNPKVFKIYSLKHKSWKVTTASGVIEVNQHVDLTLDIFGVVFTARFLLVPGLSEQVLLSWNSISSLADHIDVRGKRFLTSSGEWIPFGQPDSYELVVKTLFAQQRDESPFVMLKEPELDFYTCASGGEVQAVLEKNNATLTALIESVWYFPMKELILLNWFVFTEELLAGMIPDSRGDDDCVIEVIDPDTPAIKAQWPLSPEDRSESRLVTKSLKASTVVENSSSTRYAAPILFVAKKDGTRRMCVDYRYANQAIANHQCDVPVIEDLVSKVVGKKWFSAVDLTSAFHQQRIRPECRDITTFIIEGEPLRFGLLPFGLKVSPAIMQTTIAKLIEGIPGVYNYIDDIILAADTEEEHLEQLRLLFVRFKEKRFYLKASKCEIMKSSVTFLGYKVLRYGMEVPDARREVFRTMLVPDTRKGMQSALGLFNYFRCFVLNYAYFAKPLQVFASATGPLTKKEKLGIIAPFERLRRAMLKSSNVMPILSGYEFVMEVDASCYAIGAVLFQDYEGQKYGPVAILLKSLDVHQQNYPTRQKELLAIVYACERWSRYLLGTPITVYSDHSSLLSFLKTAARPEIQRLSNWVEKLQGFMVTIVYRKGSTNHLADFLSRQILPVKYQLFEEDADARMWMQTAAAVSTLLGSGPSVPSNHDAVVSTQVCMAYRLEDAHADEVRAAYAKEHRLTAYIDRIKAASPEKLESLSFRKSVRFMILVNGLLVRGGKVVLTNQLAKKWIKELHQRSHRGITEMVHEFQEHFYAKRYFDIIETIVKKCDTCQRRKTTRVPPLPLQALPVPNRPFEVIHIDEVSALPTTEDGFYAVFSVIDRLGRFAVLTPVKHGVSALEVATILVDQVFSIFGHPKVIISDKAPAFLSQTVEQLRVYYGIDLNTTSTNHPETNGSVERAQRTIVEMLRCMCGAAKVLWPSFVKLAQYEYNRSWNRAIGTTPYRAVFGVDPPPIKAVMPGHQFKDLENYIRYTNAVRAAIRNVALEYRDDMVEDYNKKRDVQVRQFEVGQWVLVNKQAWFPAHQQSWKAYDCFYGPFEIVGIPHKDNPTVVYVCLDPRRKDTRTTRLFRKCDRTINTKYLKLYVNDVDGVSREPGPSIRQPESVEELIDRQYDVNYVAYVDMKDRSIGVSYRGAPEGMIARIPFEWYARVNFALAFTWLEEFLAQSGSSIGNKPTIFEGVYGKDWEGLVRAVRPSKVPVQPYEEGIIPPREPVVPKVPLGKVLGQPEPSSKTGTNSEPSIRARPIPNGSPSELAPQLRPGRSKAKTKTRRQYSSLYPPRSARSARRSDQP